MKRLMLAVLVVASVAVSAQSYLANVTVAIDATVGGVGFSSSDISAGSGHPQATGASCVSDASGGAFRYRVDGSAPTSSVGVEVQPADTLVLNGPTVLQNFKGIRTGSTSASLKCVLWGN